MCLYRTTVSDKTLTFLRKLNLAKLLSLRPTLLFQTLEPHLHAGVILRALEQKEIDGPLRLLLGLRVVPFSLNELV